MKRHQTQNLPEHMGLLNSFDQNRVAAAMHESNQKACARHIANAQNTQHVPSIVHLCKTEEG